jgi:hypothetical protein
MTGSASSAAVVLLWPWRRLAIQVEPPEEMFQCALSPEVVRTIARDPQLTTDR